MSTLQKPHTVEVNYFTGRVLLKNVNASYKIRLLDELDTKFLNLGDFQYLPPVGKGGYFLMKQLYHKILKSKYSKSTTINLTIPEAVLLYNYFWLDYYLGTEIHYTAGLIHQKLS